MKKKIFLLGMIPVLFFYSLLPGNDYEVSFDISGNAKGRILIIFPYRVFYKAHASLIFTLFPGKEINTFRLKEVTGTGYMMRTLGFSGKSLAVLTADASLDRARSVYEDLISRFPVIAPGFHKFINKSYWNNFSFGKIRDSMIFKRTQTGKTANLDYHLQLKRSDGQKQVSIYFNIYRILGEIIKAYNHPLIPEDFNPDDLSEKPVRWKSDDIDYSATISQSALYAASIFRKIKPLQQEKPFNADYSATRTGGAYLIIKGVAKPGVAIWGNFRIVSFLREARFRINDMTLLSDRIIIRINNGAGKGGIFRSNIRLVDPRKN